LGPTTNNQETHTLEFSFSKDHPFIPSLSGGTHVISFCFSLGSKPPCHPEIPPWGPWHPTSGHTFLGLVLVPHPFRSLFLFMFGLCLPFRPLSSLNRKWGPDVLPRFILFPFFLTPKLLGDVSSPRLPRSAYMTCCFFWIVSFFS